MHAQRPFMVFSDDGWAKDFVTFKGAENHAKAIYVKGKRDVKITMNGVTLACFRADENGVIWTDLTFEGCKYS